MQVPNGDFKRASPAAEHPLERPAGSASTATVVASTVKMNALTETMLEGSDGRDG